MYNLWQVVILAFPCDGDLEEHVDVPIVLETRVVASGQHSTMESIRTDALVAAARGYTDEGKIDVVVTPIE